MRSINSHLYVYIYTSVYPHRLIHSTCAKGFYKLQNPIFIYHTSLVRNVARDQNFVDSSSNPVPVEIYIYIERERERERERFFILHYLQVSVFAHPWNGDASKTLQLESGGILPSGS